MNEIVVHEIVDLRGDKATTFEADGRVVEFRGPKGMEVSVQLTGDTIEVRSTQHSRLLFTSEGSNGIRIKPSWETL